MLKVSGDRPQLNRFFPIATFLSLIAAIFFFYIWHLGTLTPGFSQAEIEARTASSSFDLIASDPIFAPHKLIQLMFQSLGENGAFWMRLASVIFALAFLVFFYFLLKMWFGKLISLIGTLLFAATPSLILVARSTTPDVLFLVPIAVIASFVWLSRTSRKNLAWLSLIMLTALSLYVPGMVYFVLLGLAILYQPLKIALRSVDKKMLALSLLLGLLLLLPLALAAISDISLLRRLLLAPESWPGALETAKSIIWSLLSLFLRARENSAFIIGRLPILSGIQIVLLIFGLYALFSRARKEFYLIIAIIGVGVIFSGLNHTPALLIPTLPVLGILAATGLRYLYKEWRGVFPINPLPRALAVCLMTAVVLLQLLYGARYALLAWPNTEATRSAYNVLK